MVPGQERNHLQLCEYKWGGQLGVGVSRGGGSGSGRNPAVLTIGISISSPPTCPTPRFENDTSRQETKKMFFLVTTVFLKV